MSDFLKSEKPLLGKVRALMRKLNTIKGRVRLRKITDLASVLHNDTRWSNTYAMVQRYITLEPDICSIDHETVTSNDLHTLFLTEESERIKSLLVDLEKLKSVTKMLQQSSLTLSGVHRLFDNVFKSYSEMSTWLSSSSSITNHAALERGFAKIQRNEQLSALEKSACVDFKCSKDNDAADEGEEACSFATAAFKKRKVVR